MMSGEWRGFSIALVLATYVLWNVVADAASENTRSAKIDAEYVAKLNALVERGPDGSLNAEPFYLKAFELYVQPPAGVDVDAVRYWPAELPEIQRTAIRKWVDTNSDALTQLHLGVQRPRYWFQYAGDVWKTWRSNYIKARLPEALGFRAKLEAMDGNKQDALRDLMACYRFGLDMQKRLLLSEQMAGLVVSTFAVEAGFQILKETELDHALLESLHRQLAELSGNRGLPINLAGHELMTLAVIEKICAQWPGNSGKTGTQGAEKLVAFVWAQQLREEYQILVSAEQVYSSLHDHTAEEMARLVRKAYVYFNSIISKTPFQMHEEEDRWDKIARESVDGNLLLLAFVPPIPHFSEISFRCQVERDALVTSLAVLRYRNDRDSFPVDLQELVSGGYMSQLAMDPYSDKPLVYRRMGSSFILYSIGADFQDNGGRHSSKWGVETRGGDCVFWPVQKTEYTRNTPE
jgi:hypothetical protein